MNVEAKNRLKWARDMLSIARNKLVVERDRTSHGHAIDMIQIITMVDAASLVCKEVVGGEDENKG
jgi:hypothetical protein